jgi:hypothetical protein
VRWTGGRASSGRGSTKTARSSGCRFSSRLSVTSGTALSQAWPLEEGERRSGGCPGDLFPIPMDLALVKLSPPHFSADMAFWRYCGFGLRSAFTENCTWTMRGNLFESVDKLALIFTRASIGRCIFQGRDCTTFVH